MRNKVSVKRMVGELRKAKPKVAPGGSAQGIHWEMQGSPPMGKPYQMMAGRRWTRAELEELRRRDEERMAEKERWKKRVREGKI